MKKRRQEHHILRYSNKHVGATANFLLSATKQASFKFIFQTVRCPNYPCEFQESSENQFSCKYLYFEAPWQAPHKSSLVKKQHETP